MMLPTFLGFMALIAYFVPRNTPSRLVASTRRHSASVMSATGLAKDTPALLTSTSSRWCPLSVVSMTLTQAASSASAGKSVAA